ncbi:hypothetical protein [Lentzea sp. NEAU-D7]|uniref:hypothetical protein n=1 Tax=Lentzea sp. NEAU-D7 TaxID=2994667 RepID=UPI00224BA0B4|nr:hypothetical protein [Lentzea sp. NEAU-D7]MCX2948892.1 hypothetical protein [Lentzea sp. NEAU-D7]
MTSKAAVGATSGLVAGMVMGFWVMAVMAAFGTGMLAPLNIIAHLVVRDVPLDGAFDWTGLLVGGAVHLVLSVLFGALFGMALRRRSGYRSLQGKALVIAGFLFGLPLWLVDRVLLWPLINLAGARAFTPWVSFFGHVLYGSALGIGVWSTIRTPTARLG